MVSSEFLIGGSLDDSDRKQVQVEIHRRMPLSNHVPLATTCRCLFGRPEVTIVADVRRELERKHNDRWNFDFRSRRPLTSSDGSYDWIRIGETSSAPREKRLPLSLLDNTTSMNTTTTSGGVSGLRLVAVRSIRPSKNCVDNGVRKASQMKTLFLDVSALCTAAVAATASSHVTNDVISRENRKRKSRSILGKRVINILYNILNHPCNLMTSLLCANKRQRPIRSLRLFWLYLLH